MDGMGMFLKILRPKWFGHVQKKDEFAGGGTWRKIERPENLWMQ